MCGVGGGGGGGGVRSNLPSLNNGEKLIYALFSGNSTCLSFLVEMCLRCVCVCAGVGLHGGKGNWDIIVEKGWYYCRVVDTCSDMFYSH